MIVARPTLTKKHVNKSDFMVAIVLVVVVVILNVAAVVVGVAVGVAVAAVQYLV